jgi:hypothetical protein
MKREFIRIDLSISLMYICLFSLAVGLILKQQKIYFS